MKKTAGVYTNDKSRPRQDLVISGPVEKFATIRPQHVSLRGYAGDSIKGVVTIIPEKNIHLKFSMSRPKTVKTSTFSWMKSKNPVAGHMN